MIMQINQISSLSADSPVPQPILKAVSACFKSEEEIKNISQVMKGYAMTLKM